MSVVTSREVASADASKPIGKVELADIVRAHGRRVSRKYRWSEQHCKVLRRITACRTEALGGHRQFCEHCDYEHFVYHSCRDRHCPKCQTRVKEAWRDARQADLLPVPYFHQVFTLPHEFNEWILVGGRNQRALLKLLFDCTAETLLEFGKENLDGQVGFTLVLHTWDQQLRPHYHLHCLIPSGALSQDQSAWHPGGSRFLFPVRGLSKKFRGKFLERFEALCQTGALRLPQRFRESNKTVRSFARRLRRKPWVVYSKPPFAGPSQLLDYLSRYTHRVAISNGRILSLSGGKVRFLYRDRRDNDRQKTSSIAATEFLNRFLAHVLPPRFTRIRHYGFLSNGNRQSKLASIRRLLGAEPQEQWTKKTLEQWLESVLGFDPRRCPRCGEMLEQEEFEGLEFTRPIPCSSLTAGRFASTRGPPRTVR